MIFLRGTVKDLNSSDRAVKIASTAGKVVNLLNVKVPAADPQILLKVRFMSVDRNKEKQLGIKCSAPGLATRSQVSLPPSILLPLSTSLHRNKPSATIGNELQLFTFFPG